MPTNKILVATPGVSCYDVHAAGSRQVFSAQDSGLTWVDVGGKMSVTRSEERSALACLSAVEPGLGQSNNSSSLLPTRPVVMLT